MDAIQDFFWPAVFLLLGAAAITALIFAARRLLRSVSRSVFGTDTLRRGLELQADRLASEPKSVSAMTGLYLPQIQEDFPEFHYPEFRQKAEAALKEALLAIDRQDATLLREESPEFRRQVEDEIAGDRASERHRHYEQVHIQRTEIAHYDKEKGKCIITMQSAVGHLTYIEQGGRLVSGSRERPFQTKYNVEFLYIQDAKKAGVLGTAAGITCPRCGAPITNLGTKLCEYCGGAAEEINLRVWSLSRFYEVKN